MDIYQLSRHDMQVLVSMLSDALDHGRAMRLACDEGTVKAKLGEGMWTPPLGQPERPQLDEDGPRFPPVEHVNLR